MIGFKQIEFFDHTPASPTFAMTPAAVAAMTPAGVLALSPHEFVNLFSGALTFEVPLHTVGGRGSEGYTIVEPRKVQKLDRAENTGHRPTRSESREDDVGR